MFGKKKKKILVLEDEQALSKALCIKLEAEGYSALPAYNGEEAITLFDTNIFDLAILDLITSRVDGFGVLEHIRKKDDALPVFVVSNLSQKEDMQRALDMGANKYYIKSNISLGEIVEDVHDMLEQ